MKKIEQVQRDCVYASLEDWCYLANEGDEISVTTWVSGEGIDVDIVRRGSDDPTISLTFGELKAIKALSKLL